ncbi:disease resistance protein RPP8-like [Magnolia sinica]|uniref:disease resistance protein RPP8-like n=1 Tax=Magnolia sinica TaxID=86752 RepID=UPI002658CFC4|nr:disease resistance protein RPP8-like [Magnolia sinica]XP_058112999.1 disease resistance protein RPP8-like [Magnolia sinica]
MAESAIQSAAETLTYFLRQKDFYLSHVDVWVMSLRNNLKAILKDVDGMRGYNENVQLIEVANNTKNVIDSFIFKIAEQRGETSAGLMSYQSTFDSGIKDKPAIEDLGKKIFDLKTRLDVLSNRSQYGIHNIQASGEASTSSTQSQILREKRAPIVEEAKAVGFEDEARTLVGRLIAGDMRRVVISITGTAGTGKTALAKKVYNDVYVRSRFHICCWVNVAQEYYQVRDILLASFPCLSRDKPEEALRRYLEGMRYMVVIDDIWSREAWDGLVTAFPDCENGSRVLLTTRNEEVAKYADTQSTPHKLHILNENESWTLFCKKALLENPSPACPPNLVALGRRMVAKCGGLPLAITVLGGVLSRKEKSVYKWEKVLRSVEWWVHQSEEDAISGILALSYGDLPYYLKPYFLYFGAFPEHSEIFVDELIRIWIAEGFVQRREEKDMEDVAEDFVEELISRSMIQVSERKSNGMIKKCRINNHLRNLAISKAKNENFLYVYGNKAPTSSSIMADRLAITSGDISNCISLNSSTPRLLSLLDFKSERFLYVYGNKAPTSSIMAARLAITSGDISNCISLNSSTPHLRSLLDFSYETDLTEKLALNILGGSFEFLRVLHLESGKLLRLPDQIGDLIRLRYLRLDMPELEYLPSTIIRLSNLQTLDIRYSVMSDWLLDDITKMEQIRHLMVPNCMFSNGMQLHHLSNLQTLKTVEAGSWIEDGLEKLTNLRDLEIKEILGDVHMALSRSISKLVHLRSLSLDALYQSWIPAFESFSKHEHLYKMILKGRLEKLPEPHVFPPNLTQLHLEESKLERDPMVTLEKLPNLRSLCMRWAYMGKEMVCSAGGFPLLDTLTISGFNELEEWRVEEGAMRNLRCLGISFCNRLKMLPDGLRYIITLQELKLEYMSEELKGRVRKNEGEDWFKIRHIPSLIIK